jgi:hypothetical protein
MSNCVYCGHETIADVSHYHGSISKVCKYNKCRSDWQNFKIRLKKYKQSKYPAIQDFAILVESKVYENKEPAIGWNRQMITVRKLQSKLPIIPVKQ